MSIPWNRLKYNEGELISVREAIWNTTASATYARIRISIKPNSPTCSECRKQDTPNMKREKMTSPLPFSSNSPSSTTPALITCWDKRIIRGDIKIKKAIRFCEWLFFLVETTRFELVTPCMSSKYSNQLSYASKRFFNRRALLYHSCFQIASLFLKFLQKFLFFLFISA